MTKVKTIVSNNSAGIFAAHIDKTHGKEKIATFTVKKTALAASGENRAKPKDKNEQGSKIAVNGENNLYPTEVITKARALPAIPAALQKKAELFYSAGWHFGRIEYGKGEDSEEGAEKFVPVKNEKIRKWLRKTNWDMYVFTAAKEIGWWHLIFVEIIMDRVAKQISQVFVHKNAHCRFDFQNKLGPFNKCYISPDWESDQIPPGAKSLPVLDPFYDVPGQINDSNEKSFILPLFHPSVLENYYPTAPWQNFLTSDWYDVAVAVATFNKSLTDNTAIAYHIEIQEEWFDWKWPGFKDFPAEKKDTLTTEAIQVFIDAMKGKDKAGNVFISMKKMSPDMTKEYSMWTVNVIDNKYKDGAHIPTSHEAYSHLYTALGMDQAMLGPVPGSSGKLNSSGSEKRVASNIQLSSQKFEADLIFKVFDLVRDVNGWDWELIMRIRQEKVTTLDQGTETQQEAS